jgi:hypothetical protein
MRLYRAQAPLPPSTVIPFTVKSFPVLGSLNTTCPIPLLNWSLIGIALTIVVAAACAIASIRNVSNIIKSQLILTINKN